VILVTDPRWSLARVSFVVERAGRALEPGRLCVQLRDKAAPLDALARAARVLRRATAGAGALLVINASTDEALGVAADAGADGVHVPGGAVAHARAALGEQAFISTPAHTDDEVSLAARAGASAVLVSPIYDTPGKGAPRGTGALVAARALACGCVRDARAPAVVLVYALGGVDASRAAACAAAGADGVAVIRALLDASDPAAVARLLDAPFHRPQTS
jgi:thiamine-phosphate pyrophosphorylase